MLGPKQQQLAAYVDNADPGPLHDASTQWTAAETLLRRLSLQLEMKGKEFGDPTTFSGSTATAASSAFADSSKKMSDRADQMRDGATAFTHAANAVTTAKAASKGFAAHADERPPTQPPDLGDVDAQSDWQTKDKKFWDHYSSREGDADDAITALSKNHTTQAAVFAKIHGETPPPPPPSGQPGGANPVSAGTAPGVHHVPTHLVSPTEFDPTGTKDPTNNDPTDATDPTNNDPTVPNDPTGPNGPTSPTGPPVQ
jgi:hypothetical protein